MVAADQSWQHWQDKVVDRGAWSSSTSSRNGWYDDRWDSRLWLWPADQGTPCVLRPRRGEVDRFAMLPNINGFVPRNHVPWIPNT
eukprot:5499307-Amphidinium_carterae.1